MPGRAYEPWTKSEVEHLFEQTIAGVRGPMQLYEEVRKKVADIGGTSMKRKIMTITYTCPEDKANLGEAEIMGYIIQKLGELGAYDISMKAGSMNIAEPVVPKVQELDIKIPEFMKRRAGINFREILQIVGEGDAYGETV